MILVYWFFKSQYLYYSSSSVRLTHENLTTIWVLSCKCSVHNVGRALKKNRGHFEILDIPLFNTVETFIIMKLTVLP